jgi:hypothetical protein
MQNIDHDVGFWEKRQFFRRKLAKIAENCDHNLNPIARMSPVAVEPHLDKHNDKKAKPFFQIYFKKFFCHIHTPKTF